MKSANQSFNCSLKNNSRFCNSVRQNVLIVILLFKVQTENYHEFVAVVLKLVQYLLKEYSNLPTCAKKILNAKGDCETDYKEI